MVANVGINTGFSDDFEQVALIAKGHFPPLTVNFLIAVSAMVYVPLVT